MKIQVLNSGSSTDSLTIQKRTSFLMCSLVLSGFGQTEDPSQETKTEYQDFQVQSLSELNKVNLSIKLTGSKSTYHVLQNFSLL